MSCTGDPLHRLARHYDGVRSAHPGEELLLVFDVEGAPTAGKMHLARWFQLQPSTSVAFVTAAPRSEADVTVELEQRGHAARVRVDPHLVRTGVPPEHVVETFSAAGRRIVGVMHSDPAAVEGSVDATGSTETLVLPLPPRVDLTSVIAEPDLPAQVTLVWHGLNDAENLRQFLASTIAWGECDVRRHPTGGLVLRHDAFASRPAQRDEPVLTLDAAVAELAAAGRKVKLDLKDGDSVVEQVLATLAAHGIPDDRLWFNSSIDVLGSDGFAALRAARPGAVVQCPADFLAPLVRAAPDHAREILDMLTAWGVDRVSLGWHHRDLADLLDPLEAYGYDVNLYGVPDFDAFLRAVLLVPQSVTADFNFPQWGYHGRGSGQQEADPAAA